MFSNGRYPIAYDPEQEPIDNPTQRLTLENDEMKYRKRPDAAFDTINGYARVWLWYQTPTDCMDLINQTRDMGRARGLHTIEILISQESYAESMEWFRRNKFERHEGRGSGDQLSFVRPLQQTKETPTTR